jgi:hypothetical protein
MAKKKETKSDEVMIELQSNSFETLTIPQEKFEECEWCFQFDEDEPQVFAWTDETINSDEEPKINFTITNIKDAYISFSSAGGKLFKLFPRELTEAGKQMRENSKLKINE